MFVHVAVVDVGLFACFFGVCLHVYVCIYIYIYVNAFVRICMVIVDLYARLWQQVPLAGQRRAICCCRVSIIVPHVKLVFSWSSIVQSDYVVPVALRDWSMLHWAMLALADSLETHCKPIT